MDIERLKEHILENDMIPKILTELGCHSLKHKDNYYQCANPDGDNVTAVCVYENTNLTTVNYTREISKGKLASDIISLVEFYKTMNFPQAIKWICDVLDLDYYHDFDADLPESLKITRMLLEMQTDYQPEDEEKPLIPISEKILTYYKPYVNDMFFEDGISYETQREFEIGYDEQSDRITIPIRDDIGNLVGIKGRLFNRTVPEGEMKYIYLEKCAKSQILYGLYKSINAIKTLNFVYVTEAEKGVQQLFSYGFENAVSTSGCKLSKFQIEKLTRLCVPIYFVFDKDVDKTTLQGIADRFIDEVEVYAVIDTLNILNEKESPTDNKEKFERLKTECVFKLK